MTKESNNQPSKQLVAPPKDILSTDQFCYQQTKRLFYPLNGLKRRVVLVNQKLAYLMDNKDIWNKLDQTTKGNIEQSIDEITKIGMDVLSIELYTRSIKHSLKNSVEGFNGSEGGSDD